MNWTPSFYSQYFDKYIERKIEFRRGLSLQNWQKKTNTFDFTIEFNYRIIFEARHSYNLYFYIPDTFIRLPSQFSHPKNILLICILIETEPNRTWLFFIWYICQNVIAFISIPLIYLAALCKTKFDSYNCRCIYDIRACMCWTASAIFGIIVWLPVNQEVKNMTNLNPIK